MSMAHVTAHLDMLVLTVHQCVLSTSMAKCVRCRASVRMKQNVTMSMDLVCALLDIMGLTAVSSVLQASMDKIVSKFASVSMDTVTTSQESANATLDLKTMTVTLVSHLDV